MSSINNNSSSYRYYYTREKIYELLPAIYRQQDGRVGNNNKPLQALLSIIAEQVEILEKDIENLYDNWFIETCEEWLVPYIGNLVGAKLLFSVERATVSQRTWVANTIGYRRRKGTAAVLEQIARDVTGWNAKAVEFFQLLSTTQYVNNHLRPANYFAPDLRESEKLELLGGPFDTIAHTPDIHDIKTGHGYHNIPNIGLFVWRLQAYPVNNAPAYDHGNGKYSFNQLGFDMQLFNHPVTETAITHLTEEINVPHPIRRLSLKDKLDQYYGNGKSILIVRDGIPVSREHISVSNLEEWVHRPKEAQKVAIDPVLGRIAFKEGIQPSEVYVNYFYGFSAAPIGGGFYNRGQSDVIDDDEDLPPGTKIYKISKDAPSSMNDNVFDTISGAIERWHGIDNSPSAIFEIMDSEFYAESIDFDLEIPGNCKLIIKSVERQRPVLRADPGADVGGQERLIKITGKVTGENKNSSLILDGLLIDKSLNIKINPGELSSLTISHCTLVPRSDVCIEVVGGNDGHNDGLLVTIRNSICGKIAFNNSEAKLSLSESIVDVKEAGIGGQQDSISSSVYAIDCFKAKIENSTIFGKVNAVILELASNSIFTDKVIARRRQEGCARFSYVPEGSEVPRLYRCQPDYQSTGSNGGGNNDNSNNVNSAAGLTFTKVRPQFTSESYGSSGYAQLHKKVATEIFMGADNGSEMGVFNSLYEPQRIRNLELSLDEYLRFGLEAGIIRE